MANPWPNERSSKQKGARADARSSTPGRDAGPATALPPVRRPSETVDFVTGEIKAGIREGRLAPGQRLIETDLARTLGVSRGPLREALRRIAAEGLIELTPNRGAVVRKLTREEVEEIFEILAALTHLAIRKVAERIGEPHVRARIEAALAEARAFDADRDRRAVTELRDRNIAFHNVLYDLSGNRMLADIRENLRLHVFRLTWEGYLTGDRNLDWTAGHAETLESILAGDAEAAVSTKIDSLKTVRQAILALPDAAFK